jgi:hypothetical protein
MRAPVDWYAADHALAQRCVLATKARIGAAARVNSGVPVLYMFA